jgi:hypothetical protein
LPPSALCPRLAGEPLAQLEGLPAIDGELFLAALRLRRRVEPRRDVLRIVVELVHVVREQGFRRTEDPLQDEFDQRDGLVVPPLFHPLFGQPHRVDESSRHLPAEQRRRVGVVDVIGENQPFEKGLHHPGRHSEVVRRSQDERIHPFDRRKQRLQVVLYGAPAVARAAPELAREAAHAARVAQVVQMEQFRFRALRRRAFERLFEERRGVPGLPRTSVDRKHLHEKHLPIRNMFRPPHAGRIGIV